MPEIGFYPAILLTVLLLSTASLQAAPAHWYLWRSKVDGDIFCSQTSPGSGWELVRGPFRNPMCR